MRDLTRNPKYNTVEAAINTKLIRRFRISSHGKISGPNVHYIPMLVNLEYWHLKNKRETGNKLVKKMKKEEEKQRPLNSRSKPTAYKPIP